MQAVAHGFRRHCAVSTNTPAKPLQKDVRETGSPRTRVGLFFSYKSMHRNPNFPQHFPTQPCITWFLVFHLSQLSEEFGGALARCLPTQIRRQGLMAPFTACHTWHSQQAEDQGTTRDSKGEENG